VSLDQRADLEDLDRFLDRHRPRPGAAVALAGDRVLVLQQREGLADGVPGGSVLLGELALHQPLPGRELTPVNGHPQLVKEADGFG
jgi:hypothetical protein